MTKIPKGKAPLFAYIPTELRDQFYRFVKAKYANLHGGLSIEVQNAIAHWLNEQGLAAHTNTRINPGKPKAQEKIDRIVAWLKERGYTNQFSIQDWEKACIHTVGGDRRTVEKYLKLAAQMGRIKFYAGKVWEII
jgi:hypothetical protein